MVYLRIGTRLLFLRCPEPVAAGDTLREKLQMKPVSLTEGLRESDENTALLFLTNNQSFETDPEDARMILLSLGSGTTALAGIFNAGLTPLIQRIDMGPRQLVMRVPDNIPRVMEMLSKDYEGKIVSWNQGVRMGNKDQTILGFTTQRLHQKLDENAFWHHCLLIDQPLYECYGQLRKEALIYINHSLGEGSWYEYRINLYDAKGAYETHYKRFTHVVAALELGMILGENWTRDHALTLFSVLAYQLRLFTFVPPHEMKELLMGLEYDDEGNRLADFDLYHRNRKVAWTSIENVLGKKGKRNKALEGAACRTRLLSRLPINDRKRLAQLELALEEKE